MLWVGLTGGIASGKSTVSNFLKQAGIPVVDADLLSRLATEKGQESYTKVLSHFGKQILLDSGEIDRKKLGALVFEKPDQLRILEAAIHPFVQQQTALKRAQFENENHPFAVYDVPLLFEKKMEPQFQRVVLVHCPVETQIERLRKRNGLTRDEALARIQTQVRLEDKIDRATDVIQNNGSLIQLESQVRDLIHKLHSLAPKV